MDTMDFYIHLLQDNFWSIAIIIAVCVVASLVPQKRKRKENFKKRKKQYKKTIETVAIQKEQEIQKCVQLKEIDKQKIYAYPKQKKLEVQEIENEQQKEFAKKIGEKGERKSNFTALPIVAYGKQLRNLYIPTTSGRTTEIDTIIISISGIYVLETKNYNGNIYGKDAEEKWTVAYQSGKKYKIYNPIKQNENHILALKNALKETRGDIFYSVIVFGDGGNIENIQYDSRKAHITKHCQLGEYTKKMLTENQGKLTREEVNLFAEFLKKYTNVSEATKLQHIENIKAIKTIKNNS